MSPGIKNNMPLPKAVFKFPLLVMPIAMAACGSSSARTEMVSIEPSDIHSRLFTLEDRLGSQVSSQTFTNLSETILVGSAVYDGVISGIVRNEESQIIDIFGDLTIETNFSSGSNEISGNAQNFVSSDGERINGQLGIINGVLDDGVNPNIDHTVSASLVGTISADSTGDLDVSLNLEGDFYGADGSLIAGGSNGIVRRDSERLVFNGRFVAASSTSQ